ncbi:MarR family winged helix-turn-helix transcriptional regulator [Anaerobacillus sp. MEB173]|uniref:MarR family winged helix-turn-helix transcriptional regulator n=1 Tax=Anaerobacillus sp. MEB173 TaxID=3383345 RepID=UPI003F9163FB
MSKDKAIGSATVTLGKKLTRIVTYYLKPYNITAEQWSVLRALHEFDHITQKELSARSDKDQATLTKILDLLEKNEYVKRIQNPADRRSFLIAVTENGRMLATKLSPYIEEKFEQLTEHIDQEKLAIYEEVLCSIESNIDEHFEKLHE